MYPMIWDYIIVGAGSAGCALAHQLVRSGRTVLVIEAGGPDRSVFIKIPAGELRAAEKHDWGYYAEPDPSRNSVRQQWIRGKVLGGSSSINGMIYVRGPAEDFDRWSAECGGAGGWSAREIMPIFRELESSDQSNSLRGHTGPLSVRTVKRPHAITRAFIESVRGTGYAFNEDYNSHSQEGVSFIQFSQRRGLRCSAADAFLKPLLGRKNLKLMLNASADAIEVRHGRAAGVLFRYEGRQCREAARDIIICAGAINTPKLLMLSGIGDAGDLKRHGIEPTLDLPGVGCNLKDHPQIYTAYRTTVPTYTPTKGLLRKLDIAAKFALYREGPISNPFEGMAFLRSSADRRKPNLQLFFSSIGYLRASDGSFELASYPAVMLCVANSYPVGSGRVLLASSRPNDPPLINYSLLENPADLDTMVQAIGTIRRIMNTEPIRRLVASEITPGAAIGSQSELEEFVRDNTTICYHSIGTCRMGTGVDAVVSPDLRVRGTENLWICDASVMPTPINGNMNAACMMVGMKLGKELVTKRACEPTR